MFLKVGHKLPDWSASKYRHIAVLERGCRTMSRRQGIMSDRLKEEIAKELGFYDTVQNEGWGGIRARDAGNMVKRAIEIAENGMSDQQKR
jgi:small acid-soluble spore protein F (minor alpha/beta-type SASP)